MPSTDQLPSTLITGSRVTLVGLQRAPHLNSRQAIIVGAPTSTSTRYQVYLFRACLQTCNTDPTFVRVQPSNIRPLPVNPTTELSLATTSPTVPHPLTTLNRMEIPDSVPQRIAPTTQYFGSVPPTYLLRGVPLTKSQATILVLDCCDIRSVLYTISRRTAAHDSLPNIKFTLNNDQPCVMARNIILLWLILRTNINHTLLFEIWFSLRISAHAYAAVVEAIAALTGPHRQRELRAIRVSFHSDAYCSAVYHFLNKWIAWRDKFDTNKLFAQRSRVLHELYNKHYPSGRDPLTESMVFAHHVVADVQFPKDAACREIKSYLQTGSIVSKHPQDYVNPTLFKSPNEYSLHFESIPYTAFPTFARSYNSTTPLRTVCMTQLKQWVQALRKHGRNTEYMVSTTDSLAFAMRLTDKFDIVAVSNITDVVGLLSVLQATRGLVAPSGYMFTKTLRPIHHKGYIEGYLKAHLNLPPELIPAVLGWRCVGWEGKNRPDHCVLNEAPGSSGRSCETSLAWQPATISNVQLNVAECHHIQDLYTGVRDRTCTPLRSSPGDLRDNVPLLRVVNPLALLPVFASARSISKILDPEACRKDVEFSDVLGFITNGTPGDVMMASVAIPRRSLRLWGLEPSDPRDVFTLRLGSRTPYTAIKAHLNEDKDSYIVSWMMSRGRADGVKRVHLMYSGSVVVSLSMKEVSFKDLSKNQWDLWLCRASSSSEDIAKANRVERLDSCDIIFDIPQDCIYAARNHELLVKQSQHCIHSIEVVNRNRGVNQKQVFRLPYPIDGVCGGLRVRGTEAKFEVRKAKYSTESLFLADSLNKACLFETPNVPLHYVEGLLPQQLSPNELLRSELGKLHWTIPVACKGVASSILEGATKGAKEPFFFQSDDEETGQTQSLSLFAESVRRDECTGSIAADVKWMHKPTTLTPRVIRNQIDWPEHPPMTHGEFLAILRMMELRSEHKPRTEGIRNFADLMMKSRNLHREFPALFGGLRSERAPDMDAAESEAMTDRMHQLCGGRIGYATITAMMWPGQVDFLEREGNSLITNAGMKFEKRVGSWLKRGREHGRNGNADYALLAFEQGAGQGLTMLRNSERTKEMDVLVECLLEAAETRFARRDPGDYPLISACCNKAIELNGNSKSHLTGKAERLLSKAIDASQLGA